MNYSRKSLYRFVLAAVISISLVLFFRSAINNFFASYKGRIEQKLSSYLGQKVFIGSINYFPPNFIVLKNVSPAKEEKSTNKIPFSIKKIKLAFSLKSFLDTRGLTVRAIYFYSPKINFLAGTDFPRRLLSAKSSIREAIGSLYSLSREQNSKFSIINGVLILSGEEGRSAQIKLKALKIEPKGRISGNGSIDLADLNYKSEPLYYNFRGGLNQKSVAIENLEFKKAKFYAKLWGAFEEDALRLNGFSFLGEASRYSNSPAAKIIWLSSFQDLNILDLDCLARFGDDGVKIENLSFSVNNIPVSLKGSISFLERILLNLELSYFPNQSLSYRLKNHGFDIQAAGDLIGGQFNGKIKLNFLRKGKDKIYYEETETGFKNLAFTFIKKRQLKIFFEEADFSYPLESEVYKLILRGFNSQFNLRDKKIIFGFTSSLYDGILKGEGIIDVAQLPLKNYFNLKVKGINADELSSLSRYLPRLLGKLDSDIYMRNYPEAQLRGTLIMRDGYIENLKFFNWLSEFFDIPALKKINFYNLSTRFLINDNVASLDSISLKSKELNLDGNFRLHDNDLVSGKLFLALSKETLESSEKFKPLLGLLEKDASFVNFDFQLSGLFEVMNFKWLESDFKKRLEDSLPGFIKRGAERQIEEAINSILATK